jgi:hypothetical protein
MKPECPVKEGNNFQVGKVQICFGKVKNSGFSTLHNYSRNIESEDFSGFIRYCAFLIRVGTEE